MSQFSPLRKLISPTLGYQELLSQAFELQDLLPMITTVLSCFKQRRELQSQLSFVLEPNHALIPKFANTLGFLPFHDCVSQFSHPCGFTSGCLPGKPLLT